MVFKNREEAAAKLAEKILSMGFKDIVIAGIPRGGVITAELISKALNAPLDVIVCRKLGVPGHEELGFGAIAPQDTLVLNQEVVNNLHISQETIRAVKKSEEIELARRLDLYRQSTDYSNFVNKNIFIVDDGIATGVTLRAAIDFARKQSPRDIIVSSPVCAQYTAAELKKLVNNTIFLSEPENFYAVGQFYQDFPQITDDEVLLALKKTD